MSVKNKGPKEILEMKNSRNTPKNLKNRLDKIEGY